MKTVRANAELLESQSGVEPSLTDAEIQDYIEVVTKEIRKRQT